MNVAMMTLGCHLHDGEENDAPVGTCNTCAEARQNRNLWGMWRQAVNVNRKMLESIWGISDAQLGEFCHEEKGL